MNLETNLEIQKFNPQSIQTLNDDCLKSIFKVFNASTQRKTSFYNDINYEDILFQMQVVRTCTRFRDIFIHSFWKSMDKHLTLRPNKLYQTLGPLNYIYYIKLMRCQLKKLEIQERYLQWFLNMARSEGIDSFPAVETCYLSNFCSSSTSEQDIRTITLDFLPNLQSLSISSKIKCEDFEHFTDLKEFRLNNHSPMDFSYIKEVCNKLENLRVLDIGSPLRFNTEDNDDESLLVEALPNAIEVLHLNMSVGEALLPAILNLKNLRKLSLSVLNSQRAREGLETVNIILLKKIECLTGFGINETLENTLLDWSVPEEIPKSLKVKKFIYSSSESIPPITEIKRFVDFRNLSQLCLRCCFGLRNDAVLQIVELATTLQHIDVSRCYSIEFRKLLPELLSIRERNGDACSLWSKNTLWVYNDEDDMENQFESFWRSQTLVKNGVQCPIDLHSIGFVFEFD